MKKFIFLYILICALSFNAIAFASTVDSYPSSNSAGDDTVDITEQFNGQSFSVSGSDYTLTSAVFYCRNEGLASGTANARLYSHSGTYGVSSVPNTLLATSDGVTVDGWSSSLTNYTFNFSGGAQYHMVAGTQYVIVIHFSGAVRIRCAYGADGHSGNRSYGNPDEASPLAQSTLDQIFIVNGDVISGGGGGATTTPAAGNIYMFLISGMGIYLLQLIGIMVIFFIAVVILGWPIKIFFRRMKQLIRRAEH